MLMPENSGRYVFELADGQARVRGGGDGRLRLDVRALSAIFSGFSHPGEFEAVGLVQGSARNSRYSVPSLPDPGLPCLIRFEVNA